MTDLEFLDHPDGTIHDTMRLRREVAAAIRRHRPDVVITGNHREMFGPGMFNMADHRVVGAAVLDAVRDAANRWVFPDLTGPDGELLERWDGVRFTAVAAVADGHSRGGHLQTLDAGTASLAAHDAYLKGLGDDQPADPAEMVQDVRRFRCQAVRRTTLRDPSR